MDEGTFPAGDAPESVFRSVTEAEVSLDEMLSLACRQGKQDIVELLLESGANVNHRNKAGNTPLLEACSQGHVSIAKLLLDRSANIDAPTETTYDSALTWACTLGNEEIVALLLDRRANVEHRTKDGCTALMFAALAGHECVAKLLLDHRARINVESDSNKDSPLTFACWKGHQRVVELFLDRSADIEHRTKEGFSPLMFAALGGHTEVAELLLKHGAEVNTPSGSNNDIPLTSACWKGHHQVVYLLLQYSSNIEHRTKDGCTPLMLAAREGHLTVAQLLLQHGAKVNVPSGSENNIPLTLACWKGHRDVVQLLLKHSSNIEHQNKAGCTPLMLAAREGHYKATQLLLDSGADLNVPSGSNDDTPLTLACWKGHSDVVRLLIHRSSDVNHQTKTGCTPLMEATREGHVNVARLLLEAGADVETPDNYGQSPFFMACWKGHADVAALLLEYEANRDCRTKTGITPLFQACRENHVEVVKLLLDYGCNPSNPFPNSRECPLTLAAEKGYVELTQLLLSRNSSVEVRTKKGCSPFLLACKEGYQDIAVMLAKHGADTEATDQRGISPLLASFRSGHVELVDWLLGHVSHLPSDIECQRALVAPMPNNTDLLPRRSKSLEMIMKAKKAREQAALRNAQSLFEELDAEKERQESKKKAAAKKRSKRKERKRKEQAEKMEAVQRAEEEQVPPADDREDPDGAARSPPLTPSHSPTLTSSHSPTHTEAPACSEKENVDEGSGEGGQATAKKKRSKKKKRKRQPLNAPPSSSPIAPDDSNDSGDDYHDAPSEFTVEYARDPPELLDASKASPSSSALSPMPLASTFDIAKETASVCEERKTVATSPSAQSGRLPLSRTRGEQQAKPDSHREEICGAEPAAEKGERDGRNKSGRARKAERQEKTVVPPRNGKTKGEWNLPSAKAEREIVSSQATPTSRATPTTSTASATSKGNPPKSDTTPKGRPSEDRHERAYDPSSDETLEESGWSRAARDPCPPEACPPNKNNAFVRGDQIRPAAPATSQIRIPLSGKVRGESAWPTSSQESASDWGSEELDTEDLVISRCITDDDKIRSQKLKASVAAPPPRTGTPSLTRPAATPATPTPIVMTTSASSHPSSTSHASTSTTVSSSSATTSTSSWQEVTRTTRTVQLTVSNTLVGRIIGLGGAKINSIQEVSGAHINVSRNIPKSTERLITIKGTQRSITKAQELIDQALSSPDRDLDAIPSSPPALAQPRTASPLSRPDAAPPPLASNPPLAPPTSPAPLGRRLKKRHSDSVLSGPNQAPPTQVQRAPVSVPTTVSESSKYLPTDATSTAARSVTVPGSNPEPRSWDQKPTSQELRPNPWKTVPTSAIAAGPAPPPKSPAHSNNSPTHSILSQLSPKEPDSAERSRPQASLPPIKSNAESSLPRPEARVGLHSVTPDPTLSFPGSTPSPSPAVCKHARSLSDSQLVADGPALANGGGDNPVAKSVSGSLQLAPFSPSMPTINSPPHAREEKSLVAKEEGVQRQSERLPFGSGISEERGTDGEKVAAPPLQKGAPSPLGGRDLGTVAKPARNVAVIQPTQHQRSSLPPSSQGGSVSSNLPTSSSSSSSSSASSSSSCPSSQAGNFGAIGSSRRTAVPPQNKVGGHQGAPRKSSYPGLTWGGHASFMPPGPEGVGSEADSFPHPPFTAAPPPHSVWKTAGQPLNPSASLPPGWLNTIPEVERSRSQSWAGMYHGNAQMVYLTKPPPVAADDVFPAPNGPHHNVNYGESLSGEILPGKGFQPPSGAYGAIGSNVPCSHQAPRPMSVGDFETSSVGGNVYSPSPWHSSFPSNPIGHKTGNFPPPPPPPLPHFVAGAWPAHPPRSRVAPHPQTISSDVGGTSLGPGEDAHPKHWPPQNFARLASHPGSHPHAHPHPPTPPTFRPPRHPQQANHLMQAWNSSSVPVPPSSSSSSSSSSLPTRNSTTSDADLKKPHSGVFPTSEPNPWAAAWGGRVGAGPGDTGKEHGKHGARFGRSLSLHGIPEHWLARPNQSESSSELGQLMESLDIADHIQVFKDRKLSLEQLCSLSDEEWRGLKLPMGPRVKLMNAVANIARSGTKPLGSHGDDVLPDSSHLSHSFPPAGAAADIFM